MCYFSRMQRFLFFFLLILKSFMAAAEVLAIDDNSLFTDPLPDSSTNANPNANIFFSYYTLLEPSFVDKSSSLIPVPPDLIGSGDIFINSSDDPSVGELDLLSENFDPELLASTRTSSESPPNDCAAVPPFQSRRRRKRDNAQPLQCPASEIGTGTGDDAKPYFRDFRELARQSPQKVSNFDKKNCGGILPYLVCSSNDPFYTIYRPGLLSWVLYESSRVGNENVMANCQPPSELFCCGAWYSNGGFGWGDFSSTGGDLGIGTVCQHPAGFF